MGIHMRKSSYKSWRVSGMEAVTLSLNYSPKERNLGGLNHPLAEPLYLHSVQKAHKPIRYVVKTLITLFHLQSLN